MRIHQVRLPAVTSQTRRHCQGGRRDFDDFLPKVRWKELYYRKTRVVTSVSVILSYCLCDIFRLLEEMDLLDEDDSFFADNHIIDASVGSNVFREDSFSSLCLSGETGEERRPFVHSTPHKPCQPASTATRRETAEKLTCPHCSNSYANNRTLSVHLRMHAMKGKRKCDILSCHLLHVIFFCPTRVAFILVSQGLLLNFPRKMRW